MRAKTNTPTTLFVLLILGVPAMYVLLIHVISALVCSIIYTNVLLVMIVGNFEFSTSVIITDTEILEFA